ncbi:hypothetical protein ACQ4PT_056607 [Festuca glaucescens]
MDKSGYSPTPSRSTPDHMEANEEALTPLNKESPESGLYGCPVDLPGTIETPAAPITRWLEDRNDNLVTNEANVLRPPSHSHVKAGAAAGSLTQLIDSQKINVGSNEFATLAAPMLEHDVDALLNDFSLQGPSADFCGTLKPRDPLEDFLNETIADPDEHSSSTSKVQYDSDTGIMPAEFDNNWVMQGDFLDDSNWLENLNFEPDETNPQLSGLYENAAVLPYDSTNPDVLSMDSGDESLQDLFNNTMEDPSGRRDVYEPGFNAMHQQLQSNMHPNILWSREPGYNAMHQQLQSTMQPNYVISQQGIASRRLKLCNSLSAVGVESQESMTRDEHAESDVVTSKYMGGSDESTADVDDAESTGVTIMRRHRAPSSNVPSDGDDAESTGVTIMSRRRAPSSNVPSDGDEAESTGVTKMNQSSAPSACVPSDGDDDVSTGINIMSRDTVPSSNTDSSLTEQGAAVRRLRLQSNLSAGLCSSVNGLASCTMDKNESDEGVKAEIEEHVETNFPDKFASVGNSQPGAQTDMPDHDGAMLIPGATSVMRQRKTLEKRDKEKKQECGLQSHVREPRKRGGFPAHIIWPVLSVALLVLVSVGMYGWA